MTDRKLLELAAKAAGIEVYESTDGTVQNRPILAYNAGGGMGTMPYEEQWNPLRDDHQAFRLAVKLDMDILQRFVGGRRVECLVPGGSVIREMFNDNPYAATCRAIVRAAAAIGETK